MFVTQNSFSEGAKGEGWRVNCQSGSAALTGTVVGLRSRPVRLTPLPYPPVKVVRGVLGELAGRLPPVIVHVEITSARQAEDLIYGGKRGRPVFLSSAIIRSESHQSRFLFPLTTVRLVRPVGTVRLVVTPQVGLDAVAIVTHEICVYRANNQLHHI